jgi:hypothetical protein
MSMDGTWSIGVHIARRASAIEKNKYVVADVFLFFADVTNGGWLVCFMFIKNICVTNAELLIELTWKVTVGKRTKTLPSPSFFSRNIHIGWTQYLFFSLAQKQCYYSKIFCTECALINSDQSDDVQTEAF